MSGRRLALGFERGRLRGTACIAGVLFAAVLIGSMLAFAEVWTGAGILPSWAPRAPYRLARALPTLPFAGSPAWAWVRRHVVGVSRWPTAAAPWSNAGAPSEPALGPGAYLGWSDGVRGSITFHGHACSASDPLVTLTLSLGDTRIELERSAVVATDDDVGIGYHLPLTTVTAPLPPGEYSAGATARCRSGEETRHQLGAVRIVARPADSAGLVVSTSSTPSGGVPAVLSVFNLGHRPARLTRVEYAPEVAATGQVLAGAGSVEQVARWRASLFGSEPGGSDPTSPDALPPGATQTNPTASGGASADGSGPRTAADQALRVRPAASLDLTIEPDQAALIVVTTASLYPTRPSRPVLFRPLVLYETAAGEQGGMLVRDRLAVGWTGP